MLVQASWTGNKLSFLESQPRSYSQATGKSLLRLWLTEFKYIAQFVQDTEETNGGMLTLKKRKKNELNVSVGINHKEQKWFLRVPIYLHGVWLGFFVLFFAIWNLIMNTLLKKKRNHRSDSISPKKFIFSEDYLGSSGIHVYSSKNLDKYYE